MASNINCFFAFEFLVQNNDFRINRVRTYLSGLLKSGAIDPPQKHKLTAFFIYYMQNRLTFEHIAKVYVIRDTQLRGNAAITHKVISIAAALGVFQKNSDNVLREIKLLIRQYQNGAMAMAMTTALDSFFNRFDFGVPALKARDRLTELSINNSFPRDLCAHLVSELGEERAEKLMSAANFHHDATFRLNRFRLRSEEARARFIRDFADRHECDVYQVYPGFDLYFMTRSAFTFDLTETPDFRKGDITPMGRSAYLAALILDPRGGETILDTCASPGNKSTHMAELTGCDARIVAIDLTEQKTAKIVDNVERLELRNVYAVTASSETLDAQAIREKIKGLGFGSEDRDAPFDRILVDAPCSGLGLLRNRVDLRYRFSRADLSAILPIQTRILDRAANMLRPGGRLLYCTCTINSGENAGMADAFLASHSDFSKLPVSAELARLGIDPGHPAEGDYLQFLPDTLGREGFFFALFEKRR